MTGKHYAGSDVNCLLVWEMDETSSESLPTANIECTGALGSTSQNSTLM
jgi:hypothetical protein